MGSSLAWKEFVEEGRRRKNGNEEGRAHAPDAEAMDAGVVVAVEEDGFGWGDRLQARHYDTRRIDGR